MKGNIAVLSFQCACGKKLKIKDESVGRKVECPRCHARVRIQQPAAPPPVFHPPAQPVIPTPRPSPLQSERPRLHPAAHRPSKRKSSQTSNQPNGWIITAVVVAIVATVASIILGALLIFGLPFDTSNRATQQNVSESGTRLVRNSMSSGSSFLSVDDVRGIAEEYVSLTRRTHSVYQNTVFDVNALAIRATAGVGLKDSDRKAIIGELVKPSLISSSISQVISQDRFSQSPSCHVLGLRNHNNEVRAMVRMFSQGEFCFLDLIFHRNANGDVRVADAFVVSEGEYLSRLMHKTILELSNDESRLYSSKLADRQSQYVTSLAKINEVLALMKSRPEQALQVFNKLPKTVRRRKDIMLLKLQVTTSLSGAVHEQAHKEFQLAYGDDCSGMFAAIKYFSDLGDLDSTLESIDRLNRFVGGDSMLTALKGTKYFLHGRISDANRAHEQAISEAPPIEEPYLFFITQSLRSKNYDDAIGWLSEFEEKFPNPISELKHINGFRDFQDSLVYRDWRASLVPLP